MKMKNKKQNKKIRLETIAIRPETKEKLKMIRHYFYADTQDESIRQLIKASGIRFNKHNGGNKK